MTMMMIRIGIWFSMTVICLPKKTVTFVIVSSATKNSISRHVSAIWQAKINLYSFTREDKRQQTVRISAAYWQATQIEYNVRTERQSPFLLVGLDEKSRCRQLSIKKQNYLSLTICHSDLTSHSKSMLRDRSLNRPCWCSQWLATRDKYQTASHLTYSPSVAIAM